MRVMERRGGNWCGDRGSDEKVGREKDGDVEGEGSQIHGLRVVLGWVPGCVFFPVCALRHTPFFL